MQAFGYFFEKNATYRVLLGYRTVIGRQVLHNELLNLAFKKHSFELNLRETTNF